MVIEKYSHSGYIYFIQDGEGGNIKIGFSHNPSERIKQLQTGNGNILIPLLIQEGNEKKEESYHEIFKDHHLHGEWFKPHDSILLFINSQKIKGETKLIEKLNNIHTRIEKVEIEVKELKRKLEEDYVSGDNSNEYNDIMLEYCLQIEHKLNELVKENNLKKWNPEKVLEEVKKKLQERDEKDLKEGVESEDDKDELVGKYEGEYFSPDGDNYVGKFKDGEYHGQGTLTKPNGDIYVGKFKDGEYHGQGTYTNSYGDKYLGEFKDGEYHGQGTLTQSDPSHTDGHMYVGKFKDGEYHGQGTLTSLNGEKYEGEYKDGEMWNGTKYDKNGNIIQKFVNGVEQK
jgi:hypothetical protein